LRLKVKLLFFIVFALGHSAFSQRTIVYGTVIDAKTGEGLPHAIVQVNNTNTGTYTDVDGKFKLAFSGTNNTLKVSFIGYKTASKTVKLGEEQTIVIKLSENTGSTNEVVVTGKKGRYRNKGNPAVTLIRNVIQHRDENRLDAQEFCEFEKYEKIQFAVSGITEEFKNKWHFKKFQVIFSNLDSSKLDGKVVMPLYIKETLSDVRYRKDPKAKKEIVKGEKMVNVEGYVDNNGTARYINYLYQDIDIYENNVILFTNPFLSPIANLAPTFYMYHLADTLEVNGITCIKLSFVPRNKNDFLFQGDLYVVKDSTYAVKKIDMTVNPEINLNFVKQVRIVQEFNNQNNRGYLLANDELLADFGLSPNSQRGVYGQKNTSYKKYVINSPRDEEDYAGIPIEKLETAQQMPDSFWVGNRHEPLKPKEENIYTTVDSVKRIPAFRRVMDLVITLTTGYKNFNKFEMGPVFSFYSNNQLEGNRLRFGGRTTPKLSKKVNFEGYLAYGFKDEKVKSYIASTYSFTKESIWEFPVRRLKTSYMNDVKLPGQETSLTTDDNVLFSIRRGVTDKFLYNEIVNIDYLHEWRSNFSFDLGLKYWWQSAAGNLYFNATDYSNRSADIQSLSTTEASLTLRYAPREVFYQTKVSRVPITTKYPVFTLRMGSSLPNVLGTAYQYQNIAFTVTKRFYLSQLGYTDVANTLGKTFGQAPFPLLTVHRANQSYSYLAQSYNMMNFLEFVSDQYVGLNVDHHFNGFFFNKVPLFKRLRWREIITAKSVWGGVSDQNNPDKTEGMFKLPTLEDGTPATYYFGDIPYVEGSIGIGNIFKILRLDLVKRFTYLDHPNVDEIGIRFKFKLDF
jgi:hypothetical protein